MSVTERENFEAERERLTSIRSRLEKRLDDLSAEISGASGFLVTGSKQQPIVDPRLRLEQSLRVELRRISADLRICELRLATLTQTSPCVASVDETLGRNPRRSRATHG
jgi:hypothetical protein